MELVDQPDVKKTYEKCKYIVKVWEHKFQKKHKRLPSKFDIREASTEVRHAYRKYFQIKSAALEQSFMDVDMGFEDESENHEIQTIVTQEENNQNELNQINSTDVDLKQKIDLKQKTDQNELNQINSPENEAIEQHDQTWGTHLNLLKPNEFINDSIDDEKSSLNLSITKKLFCGSKFSKRNPRKSLSFVNKKSETNIESLSQPVAISSLSQDQTSFSRDDSLLNSKFKIIAPFEKSSSIPVNITQLVSQSHYKKTLKTVDTGWLERVADVTGTNIDEREKTLLKEQSLVANTFNFPSYNSNLKNLENNLVTKVDYDSDDIIADSDDEEPMKPSQSLHIAKKMKIDSFDSSSQSSVYNSNTLLIKNQSNVEINKNQKFNSFDSSSINSSINASSNGSLIHNQTHIITNIIEKLENSLTNSPTLNNETVIDSSHVANEKKTPKRNSIKKEKIKRQVTPRNKKKLDTEKKNNALGTDIKRRSTRQTKVKVSLQEFSSGEEDQFATDSEEDPEFTLESPKKFGLVFSPEEKPKQSRKSVVKTPKISKKEKTLKCAKTKEDKEEIDDESAPYDLEFSVKPRIVAPRYSSIKNVIVGKKIKTKSQSTKEEIKEKKSVTVDMKDRKQQAMDKLEQKMSSGNLNENFVRINLKKKVFVRGKSGINFSRYKKAQWKSKKKALAGPDMDMGGCDGGMLTCFNCGQIGHFARSCKAMKGEGLLPLNAENEESCPYPTLEEAADMASQSVLSIRKPKVVRDENFKSGSLGDENVEKDDNDNTEDDVETDCDSNTDNFNEDDFDSDLLLAETLKLEEHVKKLDVQLYMDNVKVVKPYYELGENDSVIATPTEVYQVLEKFGHTSFRSGQEEAVMRILSGKSTLVTLSTGSGKSLCYQLPAYLYSQREPCISLIISPLVSLMEDQVQGIPSFLKAACLHTNQTKTQREKVMEAISSGNLNVLLISPEAVVAGEKQTGFGSLFRKLPPIAFACIDEAHCVSQWSHNFRPSYLMICRVLRESLGVKIILGLTATATRSTSDSIIEHLHIPDGRNGIISDIPLPDNLILTVSKDAQRDNALLGLLLSERFASCKSIIVYCTRRDECERISSFLRTSLKNETVVEETNKKRKRANLQAEPYHAGLSASRRRTIQNSFMSGSLRIVVATVAFGMGINKSDIRAVIHFNMPKSFESYVQEVGRAGRDGLKAHCHLFLDSQGRDENELRRHIHSNSIDRHVIRKLLQRIFVPCSCKTECPKHEVGFSIEETVRALDIPEENISTLLCYLELHDNKYIQLLSPAYTWCKVISYGGPLQIRKAAKECPPLAMALALHKSQQNNDPNTLEFPIIDIASAMGWESGICKHKLKNLEWTSVNNQPKRSTLSVIFSNLGFRLLAPGNLTDDQLDEALDSIHTRVMNQEHTALLQLRAVHETLIEVANKTYRTCLNEESEEVHKLKAKVREYFESPNPLESLSELKPKKVNEEQLINDIRTLIHMYRDNCFTGRAIARIFHGIQSPNFPAVIWGRCKFWRSHISADFHTICRIATQEILRMR